MLESFLSFVAVRLRGRLVPTHSYYYREGGKRASPKPASSRYEIEGDRTAVRRTRAVRSVVRLYRSAAAVVQLTFF